MRWKAFFKCQILARELLSLLHNIPNPSGTSCNARVRHSEMLVHQQLLHLYLPHLLCPRIGDHRHTENMPNSCVPIDPVQRSHDIFEAVQSRSDLFHVQQSEEYRPRRKRHLGAATICNGARDGQRRGKGG